MAKVKKTFRIEEDAYDELVKLSAGWGVAQGAAVERAIRLARQMPDTCQTDASTPDGGDSAAVAALIGQLAKKDEQIAKLMETVADSTKAVQGAQALHHETAQTLALESHRAEAEPLAKAQEGLEGLAMKLWPKLQQGRRQEREP